MRWRVRPLAHGMITSQALESISAILTDLFIYPGHCLWPNEQEGCSYVVIDSKFPRSQERRQGQPSKDSDDAATL